MAKRAIQQPLAIAVIYARYSSHNQNDASIEQQVEECTAYAKQHNMQVANIYADRATTGKTDKRLEFQRMMRHAEKGQFQVVIAYKSNRIARNMLNALAHEDKLSNLDIKVVYVKEEFGDNAAGRFALRMMMNVNQFHIENMAEDVMRGMRSNALECKVNNGVLPLGYKKGSDGKFAIDEPAATIALEIFQGVACDKSFADIARDLNDRGIKTGRGARWNKNSFRTMLKNERYVGVYQFGDVRIEDGVPPIIEKELFYLVQEKLKTRKRTKGVHSDYLLSGKLFCGKCKNLMVGMSGTSKASEIYHYYACQGMRLKKICDKKSVRRDWIEKRVASAIKDCILQPEVMAWIADSTIEYGKQNKARQRVGAYESQLSEVSKILRNLLSAVEAGIFNDTTQSRMLALETEQAQLHAKIAVEKGNIIEVTREQVLKWLESFSGGNINDRGFQSKLIDSFLNAVYLYDSEMRIVFGFTGDKNSITINVEDIETAEDSPPECSYQISNGVPISETRQLITGRVWFFVMFKSKNEGIIELQNAPKSGKKSRVKRLNAEALFCAIRVFCVGYG